MEPRADGIVGHWFGPRVRLAQDITLYLAEIGMDIDGWDDDAGKVVRMEDGIWQGTREAIQSIMGSSDYLEQYLATNLVFEPLVGELFRSGFLMQVGTANSDFVTPAVISAAEADYERNLANAINLAYLLINDPEHGSANKKLFLGWIAKHKPLAEKASAGLRPIWSRPHSKPLSYDDAHAVSVERLSSILAELGLSKKSERTSTMSTVARDASHQNIFKEMKDIKFDQTIPHQCGVTMSDSVEARATAEFMGGKKGVTITYQPALIRIDGEGKLIFTMSDISEYIGREISAETFEVNTSTHYGRMVRVDDDTVILFGDMDEMMEYI